MLDWRKYTRFIAACAGDRLAASAVPFLNRLAETSFGQREDEKDEPLEAAGIWLNQMPVAPMPADLPARIRRRVSVERVKASRVTWTWKIKNRLEPFAIPTAVGVLSALFIFGIFIRIFEVPVHAGSGDVPLTLRTPPRLRTTALMDADTGIKCLKVALVIDEDGRVADYTIIKGQPTPEQLRMLRYLLVFTVFEPATVFGRPTTETVTLALRDGYLRSISL